MKRREFALGLAAAPLLTAAMSAAADPVEGKDYTRLGQAVPVEVPGKVEVIEFFGYWCPHCNDFQTVLEPWIKRLPPGVNFRRIAAAWQPWQVFYQKLYFALEAMGAPEGIHQKIFDAVHRQGLHLENPPVLEAFARANGIDPAKLRETINGFTVASRLGIANQAFRDYRVDGVPTLAVNGRYTTSPAQAGGEKQALQVVDALIRKSRAGA
ncbi:MAG: thiol:disulfide interchange protein DsbA/DsbL [Burkholderiales bacterium]|nr:thiol:disulfide interchange protein DsbA/DsbL [Burkholderiales bacterium]MDE1928090.1 thiol:disulfide interchange protein DsbA/DsbL [Burkholderiales bacterium]MDE2504146.1 thiol:disulfide interchange protein DsbA/DsbL [Burkholderiales bacterium]